jgi:dolichyl-phosphate-mannose-protein mannosyltransferase
VRATGLRAPALPARSWLIPVALAALLGVALAIRIAAVGLDGHSGDVFVIHGWAERLAEVGPWGFYPGSRSVYPALLYLYWPMGLLLDGEALDLAIKGSSIPFDLALGAMLFAIVRGMAGPWRGLGAAALYLLNPGVLMAGPMWGQIDAAGTLAFLGALVALARPRYALAGALAVLAGLIKPQFGFVVLPVAIVAIRDWRAQGRPAPLRRAAFAGLATYLGFTLPLLLSPSRYFDELSHVATLRQLTSVSAPNPWALLVGYRIPDGAWAWVGAALLAAGLAAALLPLRRGRDLRTLLAVGVLIAFAFYFLPTRVHERYLFPALALLAPFAAASLWSLVAYVALSLAFAASLLSSLVISGPAFRALPIADLLLTPASLWAQGLTLGVAALAFVWMVLRSGAFKPVPP